MANELVSVLLPVYNGEKYIADAIDSLLAQTHKNLEIIIVDDCSTDATADVIKQYNDNRIKYYKNEVNSGIVYSLNRAIKLSHGMYLARMDADDICMNHRIERQLAYMKANPELIIISCWYEKIGSSSGVGTPPESHDNICVSFLFGNSFLHPGFFINKRLLEKYKLYYREEMKYVEDYDIAVRGGGCGQLANVPEVLIKYRMHNMQTSTMLRTRQNQLGQAIRTHLLGNIGINLTDLQRQIYEKVFYAQAFDSVSQKEAIVALEIVDKLLAGNYETHYFDQTALKECLKIRTYLLLAVNLKKKRFSKWFCAKNMMKRAVFFKSPKYVLGFIKNYF